MRSDKSSNKDSVFIVHRISTGKYVITRSHSKQRLSKEIWNMPADAYEALETNTWTKLK